MSRRTNLKPVKQSEIEAALEFGQLDALFGYHLRRAQGAVHRDYLRAVDGLEMTQKQTAILWLIHANPGVSQVAVATALGMDRATMMAMTDRLEERKLITRERSSVDRRRQELKLTLAGQAMLVKLKARIDKHERKLRALFSAAELEALLRSLRKLQQVD
ncbi:MAG TPA: MarR family transcriptional regulator [Candidatus Acidoferrum sp.]|nr:MarR family transcriptional regulator [Candidatus Acidoferrum sp.]